MKKSLLQFSAFAVAVLFAVPATVHAQDDKDKVVEKTKKDGEQIIITRKNADEKIVVEISGDKVTVNGKPVEDYKSEDITVNRRKVRDPLSYYLAAPRGGVWNGDDNFKVFTDESDHAMLGVNTEKVSDGVKINDVTKESAAEKIGLKEGDIIQKINDTKIEDPDGLSKAIRAKKPGDKVDVTYLRDGKQQKATAELTKWKTTSFKFDMGDMNLGKTLPRIQNTPRVYGQTFTWNGGSPKLGLSVQDTDEGKGVKVIEVDEDSNAAKAGVKENDVITDVDGKAVNSTDEMVKIIKESKEKNSIMVKLQRAGKTQNIEVKMPKKIKTADL